MGTVKLVALRHLRRPGGGPRIERGTVFTASEERAEVLVSKRHARYSEEKPSKTKPVGPTTLKDLSKEELYEKAQGYEVKGRSKMSKKDLLRAVSKVEGRDTD
jgi:hypothetical protein